MANPFSEAFRSLWHTLTSNDRHASHDSPYRSGQHVPMSPGRNAPLTSITTNGFDSQADLSSSYHDDSKRPSVSSGHAQSPSRPYSPGMRSMSSPKIKSADEVVSPGEIQMQNFADGSPPAPPVAHSWQKIDRWAEKNYEELFDQMGSGCTQNDINELEHELDMSLPQDVRDSLSIHDGQERGGRPTGIIFGCMLLDCEEIVQEWRNWKTVNEEFLSGARMPPRSVNSSSSSSHSQASNKFWRQDLLDRQDSQPPRAVQRAYAHPSWISLARDWGGNNIAVDLAPGPQGRWGQVILFGRDYDCKYVIAKSWSHFLAIVADDLSSEKVFVDEDSGELKLKEFRAETIEPAYMDILRWRCDQKYGRRGGAARRKSQGPPGLSSSGNGPNGRGSPYGSPIEDRGRSPQRFSRGRPGSPRHAVGSPLARVQEESTAGGDVVRDFATSPALSDSSRKERLIEIPTPSRIQTNKIDKLIDVPTPISATGDKKEFPSTRLSRVSTDDDNKENESDSTTIKGLGVNGVENEMKNVKI